MITTFKKLEIVGHFPNPLKAFETLRVNNRRGAFPEGGQSTGRQLCLLLVHLVLGLQTAVRKEEE